MPSSLAAAAVLSLAVVLLGGYWQGVTPEKRLVFALTTPVVALREEAFYRFILQGALERRVHGAAAVMVSASVFTLFHLGVQPIEISLFAFGVITGAIYLRTRNLALVVVYHLFVDWYFILSMKGLPPSALAWGYVATIALALPSLRKATSSPA
jgi:membrane protease YdiL (CAAX protease family)